MRVTAICSGSILLAITGCALPQHPSSVPLASVIHQLREDFKQVNAENPVSQLPLTKIEVVLKVSTERVSGIGAETSLPLDTPLKLNFSNQTTGTMENTVTLTFAGGKGPLFDQTIKAPMRLDDFQEKK
ncbi:hypothetical protein [Variovorax sp. R-27]|uniref:hypothetical protein n=1 Tax=Variovorax sp. R-27 TaxID=3404058 RepID=UPI003CF6F98F